MLYKSTYQDWFGNIRADSLSGILVALALIPEAIAFSIIAGVDPRVGLFASFSIAVISAFAGGRTGMISAATGAMALLMITLVKTHGLQYLFAATILTGCFQIIAGYLKLGGLMRFVSRSVVTGFVNALAILIFMAQLPELTHVTWQVYAMTATGLAIIYLFPYLSKAIPSPLVAILVLTFISLTLGLDIRTVGDMGDLPSTLPVFLVPDMPFTLESLQIILPYSLALAVVGLLESMMTATIVDDLTDTTSDKNRECKSQGLANITTGFLGGMAGCAMIGQSMINIKSGGRGRLSTLVAGVGLLILVVFLNGWVSKIPMAALVAVMIMVSISTFSWSSIRDMKKMPLSSNVVMLSTVAVVVATHNLAYGVFVGVLIASVCFAHKVGRLVQIETNHHELTNTRHYIIKGQIFFASAERFIEAFDFNEPISNVLIDVSHAHFWDITAISSLDKVLEKFNKAGVCVEIDGKSELTSKMIDSLSLNDQHQTVEKTAGAL